MVFQDERDHSLENKTPFVSSDMNYTDDLMLDYFFGRMGVGTGENVEEWLMVEEVYKPS